MLVETTIRLGVLDIEINLQLSGKRPHFMTVDKYEFSGQKTVLYGHDQGLRLF